MADSRITDLTALAATPAIGDLLEIVDVSDTSLAATGTNKKLASWRAGGLEEVTKTADYTAVAGEHVLCDTNTTGNIVVTLKASPSVGDRHKITLITDHATRSVTINRNSSNVNGGTSVTRFRLLLEGDTLDCLYVGGDTGWLINRSVRLTAAALRRAAAQSISNATITKIAFDAEDFDTGNIGDFSTNDRFDIRRDGLYFVDAFWLVDGIDAGEQGQTYLYKNGAMLQYRNLVASQANQLSFVTLDTVISLAAGDYLEMYVYHNEGGSINTVATGAENQPIMTVQELP